MKENFINDTNEKIRKNTNLFKEIGQKMILEYPEWK